MPAHSVSSAGGRGRTMGPIVYTQMLCELAGRENNRTRDTGNLSVQITFFEPAGAYFFTSLPTNRYPVRKQL